VLQTPAPLADAFNAERVSVYYVSDDGCSLLSKVDIVVRRLDMRLPLTEENAAGCAAVQKRIFNIADVYDDDELHAISPRLRFLKEVDERTGYRTRHQLVVPVLHEGTHEVLGVIHDRQSRVQALPAGR